MITRVVLRFVAPYARGSLALLCITTWLGVVQHAPAALPPGNLLPHKTAEDRPLHIPEDPATPCSTNFYPARDQFLRRTLLADYQKVGPTDARTTALLETIILVISRANEAMLVKQVLPGALACTNANPAALALTAHILAEAGQDDVAFQRGRAAAARATPDAYALRAKCARCLVGLLQRSHAAPSNIVWACRKDWVENELAALRACRPEDRMFHAESLMAMTVASAGGGWAGLSAQMVEALDGATNLDPWVRSFGRGLFCHERAWEERGSGFADTVSEAGWKGFQVWQARANQALHEAWKLDASIPYTASILIGVALSGGADPEETPRVWFERAVRAQVDLGAAYHGFARALQPRWGGSHEQMYELALACARSPRFDTMAPWQFITVMKMIGAERPFDDSPWRFPGALRALEVVMDGYRKANPSMSDRLDSFRACAAFRAGDYAAADEICQQLGDRFQGEWLASIEGAFMASLPKRVKSANGPLGPIEAMRRQGDLRAATAALEKLAVNGPTDLAARVQGILPGFRLERDFADGKPVQLIDTEHAPNWEVWRGTMTNQVGAGLLGLTSPSGLIMFAKAEFRSDFDLAFSVEVPTNFPHQQKVSIILAHITDTSIRQLEIEYCTGSNTCSAVRPGVDRILLGAYPTAASNSVPRAVRGGEVQVLQDGAVKYAAHLDQLRYGVRVGLRVPLKGVAGLPYRLHSVVVAPAGQGARHNGPPRAQP